MIEPFYFIAIIAAVAFGAVVGSFLNVVILRVPEGESIVRPASHCPKCDYELGWQDNIPIVSWFLLGGQCRNCKTAISKQYPAIEAANALLYLLILFEFGLTFATVAYCLLGSALIVATMIDLRYYIIPDEITLYGLGIGLLLAGAESIAGLSGLSVGGLGMRVHGILDGLLGVLLGGGTLLVVGYLGSVYLKWKIKHYGTGAEPLPEHARGDDDEDLETMAMGGGDIKLLAMLGAFFGWQGALMILMLSSMLGASAGVVLLIVSRRRGLGMRIPFGPWIAVAALLTMLAQDPILGLYEFLTNGVGYLMGVPMPA